ncbi:glycosyltransferase [Spirosoma sp. SC4-14]|uniref:glycosyltransferase n=1 Tax=Spirosoma sp. SC4-14 TaxID=3128900 RepID=UPI0030CCCE18
MITKPKLLIFIEYFLPGFKSGGPVQSVKNLIIILQPYYSIFVVTRDRDFLDTQPYDGIAPDTWLCKDGYQIMYCSPAKLTMRSIYRLVQEPSFDFIYANSLFGQFSIKLLSMAWITGKRFIIAPRGELHKGALRLKYYKKYPFLQLIKRVFKSQIKWHATDENELKAIRSFFPKSQIGLVPVVLAPDTPEQLTQRTVALKQKGKARFIFVSRITPKKGLDFLANVLKLQTAEGIELDIYGPIDDLNYWQICQKEFSLVADSCTVRYKGVAEHSQISRVLADYDYFILPTRGENFGHAIFEAFSVGLPVLISDQTQWRNLEQQQAGWDIPLTDRHWLDTIKKAMEIDTETYSVMSQAARTVADTYMNSESFAEKYRLLFS